MEPSIIGEEVASQPAARRDEGSSTNRGGEDKYGVIGGEGELYVSTDDPRVAEPSICDMGKTSDMIFAEEVACQPAARVEGGSGSDRGGEGELYVSKDDFYFIFILQYLFYNDLDISSTVKP